MYTQIEKCRQQIAQSFNAPDSSLWNTEDFEKLTDRIFGKTGVQLSVSTLKRIWGKVNYSSSPSIATLNALARFLDYESWRDFEQKNQDPIEQDSIGQDSIQGNLLIREITSAVREKRKKFLIPALLGTAIILIAGFALSGFFKTGKTSVPAALSPGLNTASGSSRAGSPAKFESRKTSDDLPNSVVFDYDASESGADSVFIQQSWDPTRREKVPTDGKQHTSIYYFPGYFDAKLIVNGHVQKHSPVFIKTRGWKGIIESRPIPIYLTASEIKGAGTLGVSGATLGKKTGSPVFTNTWVDFCNVREFEGIDAGHFLMEATLRNTSTVEQSLCRKTRITIMGKESAIIIPLSDKGCIADLQLLTGDRMIFGKDQDLSAFGCEFPAFQRVSCRVENGHLQISLNGKLILDTPQQRPIGDIVGLSIAFEGTGEIKNISLGSPGKPVYQEKF